MSQDDVVNLFKESGALLTGHFKLTSGRHSDVYYEKFTLLKQPALCTRLCARMADTLRTTGVRTIVGPTTGGIILAYDVARYLGVEAIYAEAADDGKGRVFKRGFHLEPGQKVAIVDDVLTTGTSVDEVIALVRRYGAEIVGLRLMLDRSNGKVRFDYPFAALATVAAESWDPAECPLCAKAMPLTQRGSRKF
ncbi:MAG TPA: orotate phosphoribosyltransferase [candidate division Zixibacteria bacterium]|nr:orotate phosphoribosyltransferase [candidate division Zixibacteria bacterium]MDD4916906.1 orotate phosphoribosyltransferase [candidate division Zixibacteria bacterium]MDM7972152.1 orotate phosphoribosyltransferase [candidate division Zixibacteria bacterium]HPC10620.1 orotate phosphoribosyltransferase [candidate division Zixibacteria bacterium]HPM36387.1 orotate phosphoribosyltransferase [candidate division Zixibacteria bacterium]